VGVLKLLLDTHCWLWLKFDASRLPSPLRRRLARRPDNLVLSSVSVMEIVIKQSAGKLRLHGGGAGELVGELLAEGVGTLQASVEHMLQLATLPELHRDPFDRLLVAQARVEGLTLVSADPQVLAYDVETIDART
jgi:PIN domain nuclease of toxin-antitoxin system